MVGRAQPLQEVRLLGDVTHLYLVAPVVPPPDDRARAQHPVQHVPVQQRREARVGEQPLSVNVLQHVQTRALPVASAAYHPQHLLHAVSKARPCLDAKPEEHLQRPREPPQP